nr:zinc ribbon domain-containing protein [Candidatus Sigynarchaeota archaeon]
MARAIPGRLLLIGGISLAVFGFIIYGPRATKNKKAFKSLRQYWKTLIPTLTGRLSKEIRAPSVVSNPELAGVTYPVATQGVEEWSVVNPLDVLALPETAAQKPAACKSCGTAIKTKRCPSCGMACGMDHSIDMSVH